MEAYGYNPNDDPTLPAVAAGGEGFAEEMDAGYRGWGAPGTVGRKTSTNASSGGGGVAGFSDGSTLHQGPVSPTYRGGAVSPEQALQQHHRNGTMDSDTIGAAGTTAAAAGGVAAAGSGGAPLHRGPSNASSTYSAGGTSHQSADYPIPVMPQEYFHDNAYYQGNTPYDAYNGGNGVQGGQAVMRESPARRLTQIQEAEVQPQHGGIARNF